MLHRTLRTASGGLVTVHAKNSDRAANECQPLFHAPRQQHGSGATAQCQYIAIPQAEETWEVIGSGLLLAAFVALQMLMLGRLFRASLLASGQKPGVKELAARLRGRTAHAD